jgi:hypothetical protein
MKKKGKEMSAGQPVGTQMPSFDSFRSLLKISRSRREFVVLIENRSGENFYNIY